MLSELAWDHDYEQFVYVAFIVDFILCCCDGGYKVVNILILFRVSISCSSCFLKHETIICLNHQLLIVEFVHSGVWSIGTSDGCNLPLLAKIGWHSKWSCIHP